MTNRQPSVLGSEVKTIAVAIGATSATTAVALTPTTGTRVRIIAVSIAGVLTTAPDRVGVYFGTGAAYLTTVANAIVQIVGTTAFSDSQTWPAGDGPIGDVDEVVSWITETETETGMDLTLTYREE